MPDRENVSVVAEAGLCIGCGLCRTICPADCIEYKLADGMYLPSINAGKCLKCGICYEICPGRGCDFESLYKLEGQSVPRDPYAGWCLDSFTAVAKDSALLENAVSGGVVTSLVRHLLEQGTYDCAFLVDRHDYASALETVLKRAGDDLISTCKSRYVPVQQTAAVEYMLKHPDERMIFVGVPCFVQSLLRIMHKRNIDRGRHLIIGLFCGASMNYNVHDYLASYVPLDAADVACLHFRNKCAGKNGGLCSRWPGDIYVVDKGGQPHLMPKSTRADAKPYFSPQRCLYCLDKLNQFADISVGDNYTMRNANKMGSSSVIIRTERGRIARNEQLFNIFEESFDGICKAQKLTVKENNLCYQRFCESNVLYRNSEFPLPRDWEARRGRYEDAMAALALGAKRDFAAIRQSIAEKAAAKKRRKSLWFKLLRIFGFCK